MKHPFLPMHGAYFPLYTGHTPDYVYYYLIRSLYYV